tara:strand:- start:1107 stop:1265 length:159 start_codon:yes stop_codon:yes gene_type:complete
MGLLIFKSLKDIYILICHKDMINKFKGILKIEQLLVLTLTFCFIRALVAKKV